jgi:mannose/fructose/N-acetylgalactosamine-specific phosphotransferase system component IIB
MVIFFRIDDRLIHGQVATTWSRHIGPELLMVANDEVAKNDILISLQKMAAPKDISLEICNVNDAINRLNTTLKTKRIFLLVKSIKDAYAISSKVDVKKINIGNLGFTQDGINLVRRIFVSKNDLCNIQEMLDRGLEFYAQMLPDESELMIQKDLIHEKMGKSIY